MHAEDEDGEEGEEDEEEDDEEDEDEEEEGKEDEEPKMEERERVLAELSDGACFGERALLKNDTRFASIVASGEQGVECMTISRADFELALGPLTDYVPDDY